MKVERYIVYDITKGYESPIGTTFSLRPKGLTRMLVDQRLLKIPFCTIEVVSDATGKPDKRLNRLEIHPVEWDALIVISGPKAKTPPIGIPITNITDVSVVSETKGTFRKKEDLMLKITFRVSDNSELWMVINIEDRYIQEFLSLVRTLKQKESDELYWSHRSLILKYNSGLTKTVDIYPLAPFLAEGEEIIWQNMIFQAKSKTVDTVQVFTNYRVFLYNYEQHAGIVILLPSIEDIRVTNLRHIPRAKPVGIYNISSVFLSNIENPNTDIIGDVVFFSEGRPFLTFSQISDPEKLASTVRLMMQTTYMQIGALPQSQIEQELPNQPTVTTPELSEKNEDLECKKCGWSNPVDSKFCNRCGSPLSAVCPNCANKNSI